MTTKRISKRSLYIESDLLLFYFILKGCDIIMGDKNPKKREKKKKAAVKTVVEQTVPQEPELIKKPKKKL